MKKVRNAAALTLAAAAILAGPSGATPLIFTLHGWLAPGTTLAGSPITADTPFTIVSRFDDGSPNLVSHLPFPGFVAYAPTSTVLSVNGLDYAMPSYSAATNTGVSVAIFDDTTPFANAHFAAGIIQDPIGDGAGIVGDWVSASPHFNSPHLVPTQFTAASFFGVGISSGHCLSACQMPGEVDAVEPLPLLLNGSSYSLVLPSVDETYAAYAGSPDALPGPLTTNSWSASLAAPEPGAWTLMLLGAGGLGLALRRRRGGSVALPA